MSSLRSPNIDYKIESDAAQNQESYSALGAEMTRMIRSVRHLKSHADKLSKKFFSFGWNDKLISLIEKIAAFNEFSEKYYKLNEAKFDRNQLENACQLFNELILQVQSILSHHMDDDVINILLQSMSLIIELNKDLIRARLDINDKRFQNDLNQASKEDLKSELENAKISNINLQLANSNLDGQAKILQADKDRLDTFRSNALTTTGIVKGLAIMLPDRIDTSFMTVQPNGDSRITFDQIREHVKAEATKSQQEIIKALDAIIMPKPSFFNKPANDKIMGEAGNASSAPSPSSAENK